MSSQRIVTFVYFSLALLSLLVFNDVLTQVWVRLLLPDFSLIGQIGAPATLAAVLTGVLMFVVVRHERVNPFLLEVVGELKEVTWPTQRETMTHTMVVIITVVVVSLILAFYDVALGALAGLLLNATF